MECFVLKPSQSIFQIDVLNDKHVILCKRPPPMFAESRKEMGFEKVSHIDGGFAAMKNSGFETS